MAAVAAAAPAIRPSNKMAGDCSLLDGFTNQAEVALLVA
jgi:hypothetical protein